MIYTVTFNPALDYVVAVNHFTPGKVNRTVKENIFYGGKGINVSALLANLGVESTALGFVAGFTGREIENGVKTLGFQSDFIHVEKGMSRINVKLKSDEESEINGMGPEILPKDVEELFDKLLGLKEGDALVLSGSIPSSIADDIYERIMEKLDGKGVRVFVDAEKDLLLNVLKYHPFLIKPNNHELGQMFGKELHTDEEIIAHARLLQEKGAVNVLVSMAGDGAILIAEDGQVYRQGVCQGTVKNSVGAGDSMVAGFLAGYLEKRDYAWALKLGTACGGATAFSDGIGSREEIFRLLDTLS
ncbi:1-phosphofructokinase [Lacrimispora sp. 210928-DFI.3.58]|uniref:1-phosphofructokinase n=1 Tax=Lacrimispora sp. 210928-DFI.3.58 TaxID=2883214 RepID=UPI001D07625A|nr:1-phosphofructokinase [Lacrimispora sp. 210928-DFI.3.58]MCB7318356.1 1-phosphofructokinase [Lacrimispora sp. 210928-DFI.3.58]